jgi:hypothetical protein
MARANTATLDGLLVGYGARDSINPQGASVNTGPGNLDRELLVVVDHTNVADFATATAVESTQHMGLPVGSKVRAVRAEVVEAFDDLTSIVVGLKEFDGTAIDADGLIASTALADIDAVGDTIEGAGDLVDGAPLEDAGYLSLDVTGDAPTSGELHVYIQYDMPAVDQDAPDVIVGEI